ncbi:MAG: TorF family putative porin [Pseudomonadales bacterium]
MKKLLLATTAAVLMTGSIAASAVEFSGNVALTTDYKFRGISQSDGPAIQGGFDLGTDSGFYASVWGSSIDFGSGLELDYIAGYATDLTDNVAIDVGYIYYDYPNWDADDGAIKGDLQEVYGAVSFYGVGLGIAYSNDYYQETGKSLYYSASYEYAFNDIWGVSVAANYTDFDENTFWGTDEKASYSDWKVAVTAAFMDLDFELAYVDTDVDEAQCFESDLCNGSAILSVSKSL